ncbi:MAG: methylisocitrate lyase [Proteobacteria bacterium]|nr:methylisocitrate lyase [Pseudomonadota bacterium]MCH8138849.1 methylisocitrate lyase [Pseudomonadota bacterium]
MTWLTHEFAEMEAPGTRLAALWERPGILGIPGAHNGMAAMLAKKAGYEALYLSGAAVTASMGLPDLGVLTLDELGFFTRMVYRASGLPVIVDADTGYGEILNVMRAVRELEEAGAAAIQIEDQVMPKKCGHLNDKRLVSAEEMAAKVSAAAKARTTLRILARTDSIASEGIEAGIRRAKLYLEAGADAIFPEALTSEEMFRTFADAIDAPLLANMTEFGRTPFFTLDQFASFGFDMVIWPASALRVSAKAMEDLYATIKRDGGASAMLDRMQTRAELYETIGYHDFEALDASIAESSVPGPIAGEAAGGAGE